MASPLKLRSGLKPDLRLTPNPRIARLRERVRTIPEEPGVYRWLDEKGEIVYVGKAKNLRQRLRSYVANKPRIEHFRKRALLEKIAGLEVTFTSTEMEALILEMNLIRSLKPRYNVSLKRDAHYVYVRIGIQETFPNVQLVHTSSADGALYLGPYTNRWSQQRALELLRSVYKFRTCSMGIHLKKQTLFDEPVSLKIPLDLSYSQKDRRTPCLDYHIKQCSGPCTGDITPEQYRSECIDPVIAFYHGETKNLTSIFLDKMRAASGDKKFECAAELSDLLSYLGHMRMQKKLYDPFAKTIDAFGFAKNTGAGSVLRMRGGNIVSEERLDLIGESESSELLISTILPQYYTNPEDIPDTIVVPTLPADCDVIREWLKHSARKPVTLTVPKKGELKRLLTLAQTNALRKTEMFAQVGSVQANI